MTDETVISFKELQTKYQLLLAENRLLKAELDALKSGLNDAELQRQGEPSPSREPENIILQHSAAESPSTNISNRSESAEKIRVVVITRPAEDYREIDQIALQGTLAILQDAGIHMIFRPNIHQKFAVTDQRIVWYGSINLLSFGSAEESIMRLESPAIASELMKTVQNSVVTP